MILIVDDNQENIFSLRKLLELHKYETESALSGEEALKKILKREFDLIILDVQMPGMDGYEVAETISGYSRSKHIPILFLSAVHIDKRFILKGYESGAVDYLTKPIDSDLLLLKVRTFYRLHRQSRELNEIKSSLEEKVTERTKELLQANKELQASNLELQQFASIASHDLQEPLRKIVTFSKIALEVIEKKREDDLSATINKVILSAERMRKLLQDLLDYTKLSAHSFFTLVDLNAVVDDILSNLELSIKEQNAEIEVSDLPSLEAVPGQLRQVFQNIISNALKFAKKNERCRIRIWAELAPGESRREARHYNIMVQDNGIGFDEVYIDKIFTLFERLHGKSQYDGTGIGLAIVKKIIEKHHGTITARSQEGDGATFIIHLPECQPHRTTQKENSLL